MGPRAILSPFHPDSTTFLRTGISVLLLTVTTFLPYPVYAGQPVGNTPLPGLREFSLSIQNGDGNTLRGVYVNDLFALPIVQQSSSNAGYVSTEDNTLTQFGMVSQFGNVGLLAHNSLSGQLFTQLFPGMSLQLIHGDGQIEYFLVTHVYRFRATSPFSVTSDFVNLDTKEYLSATALFAKVYKGSRHVTFQTCISNDGNSSWGRLFVIAEPELLFSKIDRIN
jgi:hypothetical protein